MYITPHDISSTQNIIFSLPKKKKKHLPLVERLPIFIKNPHQIIEITCDSTDLTILSSRRLSGHPSLGDRARINTQDNGAEPCE